MFGTRMIIGIASLTLSCASSHAQITFTTGTITLDASWTGGDPAHPYEDPGTVWSNGGTVNYTGRPGYINASLPLAIGSALVDTNGANSIYMANSFNWGFTDMRMRSFGYECSQVQNFTLAGQMDYVRTFNPEYGLQLGAFDFAWLRNTDTGGAPVDLLAIETGCLPAGNYEIQTFITQTWSMDIQAAGDHQLAATLNLYLEPCPAPGVAVALGLGGALAVRRRRAGSCAAPCRSTT